MIPAFPSPGHVEPLKTLAPQWVRAVFRCETALESV